MGPVAAIPGLILHIPHAGTELPFLDGYTRPDLIAAEVELLTDWATERIFDVPGAERLVVPFSRVFCDVERFENDADEPMAARGMGFYYTHTDTGQEFRVPGPWKQRVLTEYYRPHHERLTRAVRAQVSSNGRCLILDGHSFSRVPFRRELDQRRRRPDICLGSQGLHTPPELRARAEAVVRQAGLSLAWDRPYQGSLVPLAFLNTEPRVRSLMVEVNRRLYLRGSRVNGAAVRRLNEVMRTLVQALAEVE